MAEHRRICVLLLLVCEMYKVDIMPRHIYKKLIQHYAMKAYGGVDV
jgi:hypothetical protein